MDRLFAPVDVASLVVFFRVLFGALMAVDAVKYLANGWVEEYWVRTTVHFTYDGFRGSAHWPGQGDDRSLRRDGLARACIAAWVLLRAACLLFSAAFAYVFPLLDKTYHLNHFYLIILLAFLMTFRPARTAGGRSTRDCDRRCGRTRRRGRSG